MFKKIARHSALVLILAVPFTAASTVFAQSNVVTGTEPPPPGGSQSDSTSSSAFLLLTLLGVLTSA